MTGEQIAFVIVSAMGLAFWAFVIWRMTR